MTDTLLPPPQILVLEDEPDIAKLICSPSPATASTPSTSRPARAARRARQSPPDLVIVDLGLPDMDGMQVVRELQDGSPCAVLILTGRNDVTDRVLGLELGRRRLHRQTLRAARARRARALDPAPLPARGRTEAEARSATSPSSAPGASTARATR